MWICTNVKIGQTPHMNKSNSSLCWWSVAVALTLGIWFLASSRSVCLDLGPTSTETGTTIGRITTSKTRGSTTEVTNTTSSCCWRRSTKSKCFTADDTNPVVCSATSLTHSQTAFKWWFSLHLTVEEHLNDFQRHCRMNSSRLYSSLLLAEATVWEMSLLLKNPRFLFVPRKRPWHIVTTRLKQHCHLFQGVFILRTIALQTCLSGIVLPLAACHSAFT